MRDRTSPVATDTPRRERRVALAVTLALLWLLGVLSATPAHAQFPAPLAQPLLELAEAPTQTTAVRLADGRLVVAGNFLTVDGATRAYLVRLQSDGEVDTTWAPAPNGTVSALYLDALGRLYVAGLFTQIAGQPRTRVARFDATGALDTWIVTSNNAANAIAPGLASEVCIGGSFTQVNGVARPRLACVSTVDGALNMAFNPAPDAAVTALFNDAGTLYVGGFFSTIGGLARPSLARMALSGSGAADAWNPQPTGSVYAFAPGAAGQLYVGGSFGSMGGQVRRGIARFTTATGALSTWNPGGGSTNVLAVGLAPNGSGGIFVAGGFSEIGGLMRENAAQISSTGVVSPTWNPGLSLRYATDVIAEPNGDAIVLGPFALAGGGEHLGIARVLAAGTVDPQFNTALEVPSSTFAAARVPGEGSLIVGGSFVRANGLIRRYLLKVLPNGSVDSNWSPEADDEVRSIQVDALGRVYVAGSFAAIDGAPRAGLARLLNSADGAVDPNWIPNTSTPGKIVLRPEGLYLTASAGGQSNLIRLGIGATATLDTTWVPAPNSSVSDLVGTLDGSLVVAGNFTMMLGTPRAGLAKIGTGATATLDPLWAPQLTGATNVALAEFDNSIYLSGEFSAVNGVARSRLAKVSAVGAGTLDLAWAPSLTATEGYGLALSTDASHLYVAGNAGGGFFRPFLARYEHTTGWRDSTWRPAPDGGLFFALPDGERVCTGGFTLRRIGGEPRTGFACLPKLGIDAIFADNFDADDP
jgi:hypothetical protein